MTAMDSRPCSFLLLAAFAAHAGTLPPDSLACESVADLEFVAQQVELKGQPASVVLKRAAATVEFYDHQANAARLVSMPKQISAESAKTAAQGYASVIRSCAPVTGPAEVIERRPISGLVKVKTTFQGRPAELWTSSQVD